MAHLTLFGIIKKKNILSLALLVPFLSFANDVKPSLTLHNLESGVNKESTPVQTVSAQHHWQLDNKAYKGFFLRGGHEHSNSEFLSPSSSPSPPDSCIHMDQVEHQWQAQQPFFVRPTFLGVSHPNYSLTSLSSQFPRHFFPAPLSVKQQNNVKKIIL